MARPSTSTGSNAWMPKRCSVRRAVEHDRVTLDDTGEHIPNLGLGALDHLLGGFDIGRRSVLHQLFHYKRLEQLKRHLFGQAALVNLQIRTDNDNRTAGVVDALAEQVLAEVGPACP